MFTLSRCRQADILATVVTGFIASVVDIGEQLFVGVNNTGDKHKVAKIFATFTQN
jgi:hypothetical protein